MSPVRVAGRHDGVELPTRVCRRTAIRLPSRLRASVRRSPSPTPDELDLAGVRIGEVAACDRLVAAGELVVLQPGQLDRDVAVLVVAGHCIGGGLIGPAPASARASEPAATVASTRIDTRRETRAWDVRLRGRRLSGRRFDECETHRLGAIQASSVRHDHRGTRSAARRRQLVNGIRSIPRRRTSGSLMLRNILLN
jgi:hypothetical protein